MVVKALGGVEGEVLADVRAAPAEAAAGARGVSGAEKLARRLRETRRGGGGGRVRAAGRAAAACGQQAGRAPQAPLFLLLSQAADAEGEGEGGSALRLRVASDVEPASEQQSSAREDLTANNDLMSRQCSLLTGPPAAATGCAIAQAYSKGYVCIRRTSCRSGARRGREVPEGSSRQETNKTAGSASASIDYVFSRIVLQSWHRLRGERA